MSDFERKRDEAANDKGNYWSNPQSLEEVQCFKDGADWARAETIKEAQVLVEAIRALSIRKDLPLDVLMWATSTVNRWAEVTK